MGPKSGPAPRETAMEAAVSSGGLSASQGTSCPRGQRAPRHWASLTTASPCPHLSAECVLRTHPWGRRPGRVCREEVWRPRTRPWLAAALDRSSSARTPVSPLRGDWGGDVLLRGTGTNPFLPGKPTAATFTLLTPDTGGRLTGCGSVVYAMVFF